MVGYNLPACVFIYDGIFLTFELSPGKDSDMRHAVLHIVVDPLRLMNDTNLCNNVIQLNISYSCADVDTFYGT